MPTLGTVDGYEIRQDDDGCVSFTSPATIDADGANGQNGLAVAYKKDDTGTDLLSSAGLANIDGRVVCVTDDARDCVILGADNEPKIFPDGVIASKTWYRYPGKDGSDPAAYVDAEATAYVVVPPLIVHRTEGIVCGCKASITYNGKSIDCVVADRGPSKHLGEISVAAARALGIPSSPRNGGVDKAVVLFKLWPGVPAPGFVLQRA